VRRAFRAGLCMVGPHDCVMKPSADRPPNKQTHNARTRGVAPLSARQSAPPPESRRSHSMRAPVAGCAAAPRLHDRTAPHARGSPLCCTGADAAGLSDERAFAELPAHVQSLSATAHSDLEVRRSPSRPSDWTCGRADVCSTARCGARVRHDLNPKPDRGACFPRHGVPTHRRGAFVPFCVPMRCIRRGAPEDVIGAEYFGSSGPPRCC
jgi:hypothetical protein